MVPIAIVGLFVAAIIADWLRGAHLFVTGLHYADLRRADLSYANLRYTDLSYADLRSADLGQANLRSADMSEADMTGVRWANTTCPDGANTGPYPGTACSHLSAHPIGWSPGAGADASP